MLPVALLLAAVTPSAPVPKVPVELVTNGSFEEGPEGAEWHTLDKGSTKMKGWKVTRGQIDRLSTNWQPSDGKWSLDLHGSPGYGGVAQTFKTKKGKKYKVTFSLAGNPGGTVAKKTLVVRAADKEKEFTFDTTGKSGTDMGWKKETWEFTAEKTETTLELITSMTEDETAGPALDDVSVTAVK